MPSATSGNYAFATPVVDSLSVRVVVDSAYDRFLTAPTHPAVTVEHVRHIPGRQMSTLAGEWGLSLHLTSQADGAAAQYLLDFGYTPEILNRNFDLLDIDPAKLSGLILSHAHRDHYGGLDGFIGHFRTHTTTCRSISAATGRSASAGSGQPTSRWCRGGRRTGSR